MDKEKEQELLRVAKQVFNPEKYEEFRANYVSRLDGIVREDWAIPVYSGTPGKNPYSSSRITECTDTEREKFFKYIDSAVRLTVIPNITQKVGRVLGFGKIVNIMTDPVYMKLDKMSRQAMFSTSDSNRPIGDKGVMAWNGFQVIDLDLKNVELARKMREVLFDRLCREKWFLGITISSSGNGVHIWTKIIVPDNIDFKQMQLLYALNFRHKYSSVYIAIEKSFKEFSSDKIISFMDFAMFKPQQGVFIPGQTPELNTGFIAEELTFESITNENRTYADYEWVTVPALLETFTKWEWFANYQKNEEDDVSYNTVTATGDYQLNGIKIHYKHKERWQLANTLCSIYGFEKGMQLIRAVVSDDVPTAELRGDMITANNYNKPVSLWAIRTLNTIHGFNIKVDCKDTWTSRPKTAAVVDGEIYDLYKDDKNDGAHFSIRADQYLSDIEDDIKGALGRMTLLEAGAGFGKTEMVKQLGGKILLVLPFTSIIESKFSDSTDWQCFYQNRTVTKEDLEKYDRLCMTADKFAQLKMMEVNYAYFDYVVIDESHLLFLSEYRPVMSQVVDNIAHATAKVILMTGTPSGETLFFPGIRHIRVTKEDTRDKTFSVFFGNTRTDTRLQMADAMSNAIMEGKKVLFPTNAGSLHVSTLIADIERFLFYKGFNRNLEYVYYKKANEGSQAMDKITFEKTISTLDLVACTSYLSVGVDICDKFDFEIFFDKLIIAQDIEQYANRLRNNNLHINLYLPKFDEDDNPIDYDNVLPFSMKINNEELNLGRDSVKMCNISAFRAKGEYKYNPVIQSILRADKYIMYSNDIGKYYVDETAFKLHIFEDRYRYYASQLPVVRQAMERYGYACSATDEFATCISPALAEEIEDLNKKVRKSKREEDTKLTFEFLKALNHDNIDYVLEALNGRFKIKKKTDMDTAFDLIGDEFFCKSPELFQKNMPIVKTLYKFYDFDTIQCIFDYCMSDANYQINYSMLRRVTKLISIEYNNRKGRVDVPILKFMDDVKEWVNENDRRTKLEIENFLKSCTLSYIKLAGEFLLANISLINHTYDMVEELFKVLVTKKKEKSKKKEKTFTLSQNKLLWTEKTNYSQLYGNPNTKIFFIGDIIPSANPEETLSEKDEEATALQIASYDAEDLPPVEELDPSVITAPFDYFAYEKENTIIRDFFRRQEENYVPISNSLADEIEDVEVTRGMPSLFD